ncbi:MAG: hypothetical protein KA586_10105 [Candidatus Promineofilum sp.]|nr:hypothetical protein [Promineifilum sp.]
MSDLPSSSDAARLVTHLAQAKPGRREIVASRELSPEMTLLRAFQSQRLAATHADFLADPRYRPATEFFLNDVYAPQDFSQRDADMLRFYEGIRKVLPERAASILADVVTLSELTNELDDQLCHALFEVVGVTDAITPAQYAEGYRVCDNYAERARQIEMIGRIGLGIDRLVRIPFVGVSLRLAHAPAVLTGWEDLQRFLEHGFSAFKHMKGATKFLETIHRREMAILDRIFAAAPDPFDIRDAG